MPRALVVLGFAMAVLAMEVAGRLAPDLLPQRVQDQMGLVGRSGLGAFTRLQATMVAGDPYLGIRLRPGVDLFLRGHPDYAYRVQTSELDHSGVGLRGAPPGGRPYAVAIGDSFTFGVGVEEADTWVSRLSRALGTSVVNLGLPSACSTQFTRMYARYGAPLHPRVVLWEAYVPNMAENAWFDTWLAHGGGPFYYWKTWAQAVAASLAASATHSTGIVDVVQQWHDAAKGWLGAHSIAFNLVDLAFARAGSHYHSSTMDIVFEGAFRFSPDLPITARGWRLMRTAILDVAAAARRNGVTLVVVYFPTREEVYAPLLRRLFPGSEMGLGLPQQMLRQVAVGDNIDFLDLTPGMTARGAAGEQLYFSHDGHWNARGNAVVASLIQRYLLTHHLVDAARPGGP